MADRQHVIFRPNGDVVAVTAVQYHERQLGFYSMFSHVDGWLVREYLPTFEWPEPPYVLIQHEAPRREYKVMRGQWLAVSESGEVWVLDGEPPVIVGVELRDCWCREEACRYRHWHSGSMPTHRRGTECPPPTSGQVRDVYSRDGMTGPWAEVTT